MSNTSPENTFLTAVAALRDNEAAFAARVTSSVDHAHLREAALASALVALASMLGVTLRQPLCIDARGEFSIVALPANGGDPSYGCGHFGARLAELLTQHKARTGAYGPAQLYDHSGWCRLNHFDAEALVRAFEATLAPA